MQTHIKRRSPRMKQTTANNSKFDSPSNIGIIEKRVIMATNTSEKLKSRTINEKGKGS